MLMLTRKQGETLYVGKEITITVVYLGRNKVRLGVEAPLEMKIVRGEMITQEEEEKRHATSGQTKGRATEINQAPVEEAQKEEAADGADQPGKR